jgi:cell division protein ZapD
LPLAWLRDQPHNRCEYGCITFDYKYIKPVPSYDYPFNERIRTLLRLEDLFAKVQHSYNCQHELDHHSALITLFQILDVIDRAELKTDMLQELDRQKIVMESLRGNPAILESALNEVLGEIEKTATALRVSTGKLGQHLRENEWLMSIKQRAGIPGGVCEFDIPSYHYWLGMPTTVRQQYLENWLAPLLPLYDALRIILHILRGNGAQTHHLAPRGVFQLMLGGAKPSQMLRIILDDQFACFPEVSANKYAISVRFNCLDGLQKPRLYDTDLEFELTLCNLR